MYSLQAVTDEFEVDQVSNLLNYNNWTTKKQRDTGKTKNLYAQLHINKQGNDDIGNFHFHDEALKVADLIFT